MCLVEILDGNEDNELREAPLGNRISMTSWNVMIEGVSYVVDRPHTSAKVYDYGNKHFQDGINIEGDISKGGFVRYSVSDKGRIHVKVITTEALPREDKGNNLEEYVTNNPIIIGNEDTSVYANPQEFLLQSMETKYREGRGSKKVGLIANNKVKLRGNPNHYDLDDVITYQEISDAMPKRWSIGLIRSFAQKYDLEEEKEGEIGFAETGRKRRGNHGIKAKYILMIKDFDKGKGKNNYSYDNMAWILGCNPDNILQIETRGMNIVSNISKREQTELLIDLFTEFAERLSK